VGGRRKNGATQKQNKKKKTHQEARIFYGSWMTEQKNQKIKTTKTKRKTAAQHESIPRKS
jgi:hypothetical protein